MSKEEIELKILEDYKNEKNIICGCEEISFEEYRLYKLVEYEKYLK